jgi:hypothetical protein
MNPSYRQTQEERCNQDVIQQDTAQHTLCKKGENPLPPADPAGCFPFCKILFLTGKHLVTIKSHFKYLHACDFLLWKKKSMQF